MKYGYKNKELDAGFESVEKNAKKLMRKKLSMKKVTEKWSFLFLLLCEKVFSL